MRLSNGYDTWKLASPDLHEPAPTHECLKCGHEYDADDTNGVCPVCGSERKIPLSDGVYDYVE